MVHDARRRPPVVRAPVLLLGLLVAALGAATAQETPGEAPYTPPGCQEPLPPGFNGSSRAAQDAWRYEHCMDSECWLPPPGSEEWDDEQKRAWLADNCPMMIEYCDSLPTPEAWMGAVLHDHNVMDPWLQAHCDLAGVHGDHAHEQDAPANATAPPAAPADATPPAATPTPPAAPPAPLPAPTARVVTPGLAVAGALAALAALALAARRRV